MDHPYRGPFHKRITDATVEEQIGRDAEHARCLGTPIRQAMISQMDFYAMVYRLASKVDTGFNADRLKLFTPGGVVDVLADPYCPDDTVGYV